MKFEDCTKAELIWYIREKCFCRSDDIEFDILMYRMEQNQKKAHEAFETASAALGKFIELMKPYAGKPIGSVPSSVIHKAAEEEKKRNAALKQWNSLEKQYNALSARTDELLEIKKQ